MNTRMLSLPHIIKSIHHEAQNVFIMSPVGKMVQARSHLSEPVQGQLYCPHLKYKYIKRAHPFSPHSLVDINLLSKACDLIG